MESVKRSEETSAIDRSTEERGECRKIKVAFVTNHNMKFVGGGEKVLLNYIKNAPLDKFDVTVFQSDYTDGGEKLSKEFENAIKKVRVITVKAYESKLYIFSKSRIPQIISMLAIYPFLNLFLRNIIYRKQLSQLQDSDVIYFFQNEMSGLFSNKRSKLIGSNHSSMSKETPLLTSIVSKLIGTGLLYRKINGVHLFPSSSLLLPQIKKGNNIILTNGVDTSIFYPFEGKRSDDTIRFLYVARLEPYKGILKLLKAWDKIADKGKMELHIAGNGPLADEVRRKVNGKLIYHGALSHKDLSAIYRNSDIFVTTTEMDTFGLVVLEALSSGLHVIASDILKGTFDYFASLGDLEYVKNNPETIAEAIQKAAMDIERIRSRKDLIHQYLKENYDWKVITERLFEFFEGISELN